MYIHVFVLVWDFLTINQGRILPENNDINFASSFHFGQWSHFFGTSRILKYKRNGELWKLTVSVCFFVHAAMAELAWWRAGPSLGLHERALSEAPLLLPKLDALKDLYTWKILSPPDVCVSYILITLALRHGPDRMVVGTRQPQESCCEVPAELPFQSASLAEHQVQQLLGSDVISDRTLSRLHLNRESATIRDFWMKARLHKISDYVPVCLDGFLFWLETT